jgi:hypothetical protein
MFERLNLVETLENTDGRLLLVLKTFIMLMPFVVKIIPLVRPVVSRARVMSRRRVMKRSARRQARSDNS